MFHCKYQFLRNQVHTWALNSQDQVHTQSLELPQGQLRHPRSTSQGQVHTQSLELPQGQLRHPRSTQTPKEIPKIANSQLMHFLSADVLPFSCLFTSCQLMHFLSAILFPVGHFVLFTFTEIFRILLTFSPQYAYCLTLKKRKQNGRQEVHQLTTGSASADFLSAILFDYYFLLAIS